MANQTKIYQALDFLKSEVWNEIKTSGEAGITASCIMERLGLNVARWHEYGVDGDDLVWVLLAILEKEGEISVCGKNRKGLIFPKKRMSNEE